MKYLEKGVSKAVVGGWDPSARKFFKTDELSFTVPYAMFRQMLERYEESFLTRGNWEIVRKKRSEAEEPGGKTDQNSRSCSFSCSCSLLLLLLILLPD